MKNQLVALAQYVSTRLPNLLTLLVALLGALLMALEPLPMQRLRDGIFDQYQRWKPRPYQVAPVRIIDIDEESLRRVGQWPWPRTQIAKMIDNLRAAGVSVVGFDVLLSEPDRTSPRAVARVWNQVGRPSPELLQEIETLPDHDEWLARNLAKGQVVLGLSMLHVGPPEGMAIPLAKTAPYAVQGRFEVATLRRFEAVAASLAVLQRAAAGNGAINFNPGDDGVVRRVPMVLRFNDTLVPSLSAEMLRVAQGNGVATPPLMILSEETVAGDSTGIRGLQIGKHHIPTTQLGETWVYFSKPDPLRTISAWRALQGEVQTGSLKGTMVVVGSSAQALMDLRDSPLGEIIPGVQVHAQILEQALLNSPLVRPGWALPAELFFMLVVSLLVGVLALNARALLAAGLTVVTVGAVFGIGWLAFSRLQLLLNPLTPSLVILVTWIVGSLVHHFQSERQQRWLTDAFSRYVSPNKVSFLVKHPEGLELGGKRQVCSFIFTDLQGFTTLMEGMDPAQAVSALNTYLDGMVAITFKHEGTLDRIMGDAVAVVFSAPVEQPDHCQRAFDCAMDMAQFARQYAADLKARGVPFGNTRIGVHSGEVIVGNFGGANLFDYRALGDPVNTAARLESVNKHLGTLFCVSQAIVRGCVRLPDVRPVGRLVLKGKSKPLMVYEPLLPDDAPLRAPRQDYEEAFARLVATTPPEVPDHTAGANDEARYHAEQAFATLYQKYPQDPLVRLHHQRLLRDEVGDVMVMADK